MNSKEALENWFNTESPRTKAYEYEQHYLLIKKDLELLDFLIEKMYVAGGLIELKVCPLNNPTIPKWHNGIETHDSRFNDFIGRINELKRDIK